jgi:hypothetical protein
MHNQNAIPCCIGKYVEREPIPARSIHYFRQLYKSEKGVMVPLICEMEQIRNSVAPDAVRMSQKQWREHAWPRG